jgi:hypothetical protein
VFAVREFRWLWITQVLSFAGDQFAQVAIAILVFRRTDSVVLVGLMAVCGVPFWALCSSAPRSPRRGPRSSPTS